MALLPRPLATAVVLCVFANLMHVSPYILANQRNALSWMRPQFQRIFATAAPDTKMTISTSTATTTGPPENTLTESKELLANSAELEGEFKCKSAGVVYVFVHFPQKLAATKRRNITT